MCPIFEEVVPDIPNSTFLNLQINGLSSVHIAPHDCNKSFRNELNEMDGLRLSLGCTHPTELLPSIPVIDNSSLNGQSIFKCRNIEKPDTLTWGSSRNRFVVPNVKLAWVNQTIPTHAFLWEDSLSDLLRVA